MAFTAVADYFFIIAHPGTEAINSSLAALTAPPDDSINKIESSELLVGMTRSSLLLSISVYMLKMLMLKNAYAVFSIFCFLFSFCLTLLFILLYDCIEGLRGR